MMLNANLKSTAVLLITK